MGWLKTALQIAEIGLSVGHSSHLQEIKEHQLYMLMEQLNAGAQRQLIEAARHELFSIMNIAKEARVKKDIIVAASAMHFLQKRLTATGIIPAIFTEIKDKEYCSEVTGYIDVAEQELMSSLSEKRREDIENFTTKVLLVPEYKFYLTISEEDVNAYRHAQSIVADRKYNRYENVFSRPPVLSYAQSILLVITLVGFSFFLPIIMEDWKGLFFAPLFWILALLTWKISEKWWNENEAYKDAKEKIDEIEDRIDIARFSRLEREFGVAREKVQEQLETIEHEMSIFFAGLSIEHLLSE